MDDNMKYVLILLFSVSLLFGVVDINNASKKELITLKGIGIKKAEAIVKYRKKHCFKTVNDLTNVKGVGSKFLAKHKSELKVGSCER